MTTETELREIPKTCRGLFLWIDRQMKSFDLKAVTGKNWAGSCRKLFAFDDPGWEEKDPSEMDWFLLCDRAATSGMKAVSVSTYKVKAKEAVKQFEKFLENPSAYKPPVFKGIRNHESKKIVPASQPVVLAPIEQPPVVPTQSISMSDQQHYQYSLTFNITLPPPTRKE